MNGCDTIYVYNTVCQSYGPFKNAHMIQISLTNVHIIELKLVMKKYVHAHVEIYQYKVKWQKKNYLPETVCI